jgi:hypothetical protein
MAQEIRDIILTSEEIVSAIESFRRVTPHFLPDGKILQCAPDVGDSVKIAVETSYGNSTQRTDISFKMGDLLKPILRFCIENNITLPVGGRKSVVLQNGSLSLHIVLRMDGEVMDNVMPMQPDHSDVKAASVR